LTLCGYIDFQDKVALLYVDNPLLHALSTLFVALQAVLDLGYSVIWSDMDSVWLRDFQKLAPSSLDVVLVDDSEAEEERLSDNTGTGYGVILWCL